MNVMGQIEGPSHSGNRKASAATPSIYMRRLLEVVAEHGGDTDGILKRIKLHPSQLEERGVYYSVEQHIESIRAIQDQCDIPGLGLLVGRRISIADLGIMGYAMLSSDTMGKAIDIAIRFQRLTDPVLHIERRTVGKEVIFTIEPLVVLGAAYRYDVEETLAIWKNLLETFAGTDCKMLEISVSWPKPSYADLYSETFGCPVYFEASQNEFKLPIELMDLSLSLANDQAARICEQECTRMLLRSSQSDSIVESVRRVMVNNPGRFPSLDEVADRLRLGPRSLRRRLSECGVSFREVSDEVRINLAKEYLEDTRLAVEQVAYLVGYSEASNFYRAFKRQLGMSPSEFRRQTL